MSPDRNGDVDGDGVDGAGDGDGVGGGPGEGVRGALTTLMWEARATPGRGEDLLAWARAQPLPGVPLRRETFRAPQDRVLVLTWWPGAPSGSFPELPEPPADMTTRPVHRWSFESVETRG